MKNNQEISEHADPNAVIQQLTMMVHSAAALETPSFNSKLLRMYKAVQEIFNED